MAMKSMQQHLEVMPEAEAPTTIRSVFNTGGAASLLHQSKAAVSCVDEASIETLQQQKKKRNSLLMLPQNPLTIENIRSGISHSLSIRPSSSVGDLKMTRSLLKTQEEGLQNTCFDEKIERRSAAPKRRSSNNLFLRSLLTQKGSSEGLSNTLPTSKSTKSSTTLEDTTEFSCDSSSSSSSSSNNEDEDEGEEILPHVPLSQDRQTTTSNTRRLSTLKRGGSLRSLVPGSRRSDTSPNLPKGGLHQLLLSQNQQTSTSSTGRPSTLKRAGSFRGLFPQNARSGTSTNVSKGGLHQIPLTQSLQSATNNDTSSALKRGSGSASSPLNPLPQNEQSCTFPALSPLNPPTQNEQSRTLPNRLAGGLHHTLLAQNQQTNTSKTGRPSSLKRAGSFRSLLPGNGRSGTSLNVSPGGLNQIPLSQNQQTTTSTFGSSTLKRSAGSALSLLNPLPRNERSGTALNVSAGGLHQNPLAQNRQTNANTFGSSTLKRGAGSALSLLNHVPRNERSCTPLNVSIGGLQQTPLARSRPITNSNFGSSTLKRGAGSALSLLNSLPRNERSGTSLNVSTGGKLMITRSCAKLEDMRNTVIDKTSTCGRNISSQALNALAKISVASPQSSDSSEQDPVFFSMIQYNPTDAEDRAKYDDLAVKKYIRRHPEALKAKYDFQVGGRGRLTISRYPLSALVALGASLSTVKLAIRANPLALEATADFHTTALHTACSFNTDTEIVRYIYNKHPPAIRKATKLVYLPIHNACQASSEKTPMLDIIQFLVEEYPEGLMAINKLGDTPLRIAQRNNSVPKEVLDFLEEETQRVFNMEENSETLSYVSERQSWGSVTGSKELSEELLLEKAGDDSINEEPFESFTTESAVQPPQG